MKTILMVEDDTHELTVLSDILNSEGYAVVVARDGAEALRILADQPIDLIITDRSMPGMGGLDLLKALQEKKSTIPAIMVSAYGEERLWGQAISFGAKDYLLKPFDPGEVLRLVRKYLGEKEKKK
jgi:DNA-binding response OmpR family regulator